MAVSFLTELGRSLGETEGLEDLLEQDAKKIAEMARKGGRSVARKVLFKNLSEEYFEKVLAEHLSSYEKYKTTLPESPASVSFPKFLDMLQMGVEEKKDGFVKEMGDEVAGNIQRECQAALMLLPKDAQVPLQMFSDAVIPSYSDGLVSEFVHLFFDKIEAMNETRNKPTNRR